MDSLLGTSHSRTQLGPKMAKPWHLHLYPIGQCSTVVASMATKTPYWSTLKDNSSKNAIYRGQLTLFSAMQLLFYKTASSTQGDHCLGEE